MAHDNEMTKALAGVALFAGLDRKALERVSAQAKPYSFASGASVIDADASGRFGRLYIVMSGSAEASINGRTVSVYGPGDYFGEMSVLDGQPRAATVTATSDLRTISLAAWNMRALLREEPDISMHIIETLTKRIRRLDQTAE